MDIETAFKHRVLPKYADWVETDCDAMELAEFCFDQGFKAATQWVDCNERLPDKNGFYLVYDSGAERARHGFFQNRKLHLSGEQLAIGKLTHWMPLPLPPVPESVEK